MEFNSSRKKDVPPPVPKEFWRIGEWFPDIPQDKVEKFKKFFDELKKFNTALSLVSTKTLALSDVIHFSDCIMASRLIYQDSKPQEVFDIGSGNGFPGIIFAVLYPDSKVITMERDPKKVEFLNHICTLLHLKNFSCRSETLDSIPQGSFQCVISRGNLPVSKILLALRRPFKKKGLLYVLKGEEWATEIANIPSQLCSFWEPHLAGEYKLPIGEVKFAVVKLLKIAD